MSLPRICWRSSLRQLPRFRQPAFRRWMATEVDSFTTPNTPHEPLVTPTDPVARYTQSEPLPSEEIISAEPLATEPFSYAPLPGAIQVPSLLDPHDGYLAQNGISGLYTPVGFQYGYQHVMEHHLAELNKLYHDVIPTSTRLDQVLRNIIHTYAQNPRHASLYNHASLVWNNMFYFQGLLYGHPAIDPEKKDMTIDLRKAIQRDFFSVDNLKQEMLAHANKMFGPGFVWLVYTREPYLLDGSPGNVSPSRDFRRFFIMSTYGAGSPLMEAGFRKQVANRNVAFEDAARTVAERISTDATLEAFPVLCVSTWQHSYIADWEVGGRERFLEAWWDRINWDKVDKLAKVTLVKSEDIRNQS